MTFEEKAEIVINQLRADRDRLMGAIEKIKAEIDEQTEIHSDGELYIKNIDVKRILAKYAEQEPCDDAVSRQAVEEIINDIRDCISVEGYCAILERLKKLPPVRPQEQTGHWEWLTEDKYRCSNCNHETRVDECMNEPMYDFCPFCGARMERGDKK